MDDAGDPIAPYRRLEAIAERQCALLAAGHADELSAAQAEWSAVAEQLPTTPPPAAAPTLRRALALVRQSEQMIRTAQAELSRALGDAGRGRAAGRAYLPAGPESHGLDLSI